MLKILLRNTKLRRPQRHLQRISTTKGDIAAYGLALATATMSAAFAAYMWIDNPLKYTDERLIFSHLAQAPHAPGRTDVRPIEMTTGTASARPPAATDPIITSSLSADTYRPLQSETGPKSRLSQFELLGVFGDVALVAGTGANAKLLWHVKVGTTVPGAGRVIAFTSAGSNPSVLTTKGMILPGKAGSH